MSPTALYPLRLLPQAAYAYLSAAQLAVQERYLLRATQQPLRYDPGDNLIDAQLVYPSGSTQLLDYSVNLLGTFQTADGNWRITPQTAWTPGQTVQAPATPACWPAYDWYAVAINRLHQQQTGHEVGAQAVRCTVCHDPTTANYWHCVLRFFDAQDINIKDLGLSNRKLKLLLEDLRSWLREMIGRHPQQIPAAASTLIPLVCCQYPQPDGCP